MKPDHLRIAATARLKHSMFLSALLGMLQSAYEKESIPSQTARIELSFTASAYADSLVTQFESDMTVEVEGILASAAFDSGAMDAKALGSVNIEHLQEHCASIVGELSAQMRSVVTGNVAIVVNELRQVRMTAAVMQTSTGVSAAGAMLKARVGRPGAPKFLTPDAAGRKWSSGDYIAAMVSKAMLQLYVELFVYCCACQGDAKAQVTYPDPLHSNNGLIFNIVGDAPSFDSVRDSIWHPNSTAGVQRVSS